MVLEEHELRPVFLREAETIFLIYDKDLKLTDVSAAALKMFCLTREDLIGKNISELFPDAEKGSEDLYREVIRNGKPIVIDEQVRKTGRESLYLRIKAFRTGDSLGMTLTNITDLRETVDELETFIYKSSHDICAPISSIRGLLNVAIAEIRDPEAIRYFSMAKEQTERLDRTLKNLLETTKIRQEEKKIHLIDFDDKINKVIDSLSFMNGFDVIEFKKEISVAQEFYSDKPMIASVFQNLIDNAIKYKKQDIPDSFIGISITDDKEGIKIVVTDNGIGIPDEAKDNVFNMFYRATDKATGSGLGLYNVMHCIKKLNGRISLESKEAEGTTFTIHLPNEKAERN